MKQSQVTWAFEALAGLADRRPDRPWLVAQTWSDLLFAHWPVDPAVARSFITPDLDVHTFDGQAWLSVVVFQISNVHLRGWPAMPGLRGFPEVNLRTYVTYQGKPGVWFVSLHCPNRLVMAVARPWYLLPYRFAPLHLRDGECSSPLLSAEYCPTGGVFEAERGSLDEWLTERYCYYTCSPSGSLYRCDIHHEPWPLQPARAEISSNALLEGMDQPVVLHYAKRIEALIWPLSPLPPRSASAPAAARSALVARP